MQMTEPASYYGLSFGCHQGEQGRCAFASFVHEPMALPDPQAFIEGQLICDIIKEGTEQEC